MQATPTPRRPDLQARIVFDLPAAAEPYAVRPMPAQAEFNAFEQALIQRVFAAPDEPQAD